jgi:hypothetical protein
MQQRQPPAAAASSACNKEQGTATGTPQHGFQVTWVDGRRSSCTGPH